MGFLSKIWHTATSVPGSPEALTQATYNGATNKASWNPYSSGASVWDQAAGGSELSQNPNARKVGRTVGTVVGGYFAAPALVGAETGAGAGAAAGEIGADAATSAAWGSGAGLGGDTLSAMGAGSTSTAASGFGSLAGQGALTGDALYDGLAAGYGGTADAATSSAWASGAGLGGDTVSTVGGNAVPAATTPAASTFGDTAAKLASNPKVWQAGLGLAGAAMNSSSGTPSSGGVSDYTKAAIATSNSGKYNEVSPYGSNTWTLRPGADPNNPQPGDYIRTTTLDPGQQQLLDQTTAGKLGAGGLAQSQVSDIAGGRQAVQDALYKQYTANFDQRYGRDEEALRTRLLNEGLDPNSEAAKNELLQFRQNRDAAYADAQQRAITGADAQQNSAVARLANILAMSGPSMPTSANSSGGNPTDLLTAANQTYNAQLAASNASKAQNTQNINSLIALLAAINGG